MNATKAASSWARLASALVCGVLASLWIALAAPSAQAACPNEAIRAGQVSAALPGGTTYLPACMGLEMVSPAIKRQQSAVAATFSADGQRVKFISAASLAETPGLQAILDSYVAERTAAGWAVHPTSPPASAEIAGGAAPKGGPYGFAADLSRWNLLGATQAQLQAGSGQLFQGGLDGSLAPLSPVLVPIDDSGSTFLGFDTAEAESTGSSAGLSATVLRPKLATTAFLPGDPLPPPSTNVTSEPGGDRNNYVAFRDALGQLTLQLLARDGEGHVYGGRCGTHLGGGVAGTVSPGGINQGAISRDGARIYFSTRPAQPWNQETHEGPACDIENPLRIFRRTETAEGPAIEPLIVGEEQAEFEEAGSDLFQGASVDGTKVYFTSPRNLSPEDEDPSAEECSAEVGASQGCDLYLYDYSKPLASRLVDVSAGLTGEGADVLSSITAVSADGSRAYFVAQGKLTEATNPEGAEAVAGQPNLYAYDAGADTLAFIGTVSPEDKKLLWGTERSFVGGAYAVPSIGPGETLGGDGHILAFVTHAALAADDANGYSDVYRYDADAETLQWISKAEAGGSEVTPGGAEAGVSVNANTYAPNANPFEEGRWVSEDGKTIAFATAEPLVGGDTDEAPNPYFWKEGRLARLPSTIVAREAHPTVDPAGTEVGFTSEDQLLPQDGDTAPDVYLARVDGGFSPAAVPTPCDPLVEGSCRPPLAAPAASPPASGSFAGPGNATPRADCSSLSRRLRAGAHRNRALRHRAGALLRRAHRLEGRNPRAAHRLAHRAHRLAKASRRRAKLAKRLAKRAKRCRAANRRRNSR